MAIEGQVNDQHGAVLLGVEITVVNSDIGVTRKTVTDDAGRYQIAALPIGDYRIEVRADRFQTQVIESFTLEVGRTVTQNFQLQIGDVAELITVAAGSELIASSTTSSWPRDGSPHGPGVATERALLS